MAGLLEELVEINHQEGNKNEDTVKRIKNDDARATAKAKRLWVVGSSRPTEDGNRGPYKKNERQTIEVTPPFSRTQSAITAEPTSADRAEQEHSDSEQPLSEL